MKDIIKDRKISSIVWSKNIKDVGFTRFKEIISGYVEAGKRDKPSEAEIRKLWKDLTGEVITSKK